MKIGVGYTAILATIHSIIFIMTLWSFSKAYLSDPGYVDKDLKYKKQEILQDLLERQLENNPVKKQSLKRINTFK